MRTASGALILAISLVLIGCHLSDAATGKLNNELLSSTLKSNYYLVDKVFCYYGNWAVHRQGNGRVDVEDIDPNLCTHVIYAFVGMTEKLGGVQILAKDTDIELKTLERLTSLKKINPNLKVLVSMGDWKSSLAQNFDFTKIVKSPTLRTAMVNSVVAFLQKYNLDGFDFHWKYPGELPFDRDRSFLVELFKFFRQRFDEFGYILTAAVGVTSEQIYYGYHVENIALYLDHILLMAYDMHDMGSPKVAGQNAPLYGLPSNKIVENSVQSAVDLWLKNRAPAEKLVLGIPLHGRSYTLSDATSIEVSPPVSGVGVNGTYTSDMGAGFSSYLEVSYFGHRGTLLTDRN